MSEEEMGEEEIVKVEMKAQDIGELFDNSDCPTRANVTYTKYSNLAYVNVSGRDVHINFLETPGIRKDGEELVDTTRIYMSHATAQKLATVLQKVLTEVHSQGAIENYTPDGTD